MTRYFVGVRRCPICGRFIWGVGELCRDCTTWAHRTLLALMEAKFNPEDIEVEVLSERLG